MGADENIDDQKVLNRYFRVDIKGIDGDVPGVTECDAGRVNMQIIESTSGDKANYRTHTYGDVSYEELTMVVQQSPENTKIQEWCDAAMETGGQNSALRRDISIYIMGRDKKKIVRTINAFGCMPIDFSSGDQSLSSEVKTVTLTCAPQRVEVE
jgi:phage tail-like protein